MLNRFLLSLVLLFLLYPVGGVLGFEGKGQDCSRCHLLSKEEASDLLKGLFPDVKVHEVRISPAKSLWEVYVESRGRKGLVYVDFSKKHLLTGTLHSIKEKKNLTQERLSELNRVDVSQIPLGNALVMGNKEARIRVIVFHDPD